jgi:hypothetical protein
MSRGSLNWRLKRCSTALVYRLLGRRLSVVRYCIATDRIETVALASSALMLLVAAAMAIAYGRWLAGVDQGPTLLILLVDPLRATLAMLLTVVLAPGLLGRRQLAGPAPWIIPLVFVAWLAAIKTIVEGPAPVVAANGDSPRLDQVWLSWPFLAAVAAAQVLALLALRRALRRKRR